jgi:hypothetical protein
LIFCRAVAVIELQRHDVPLPTVDARMQTQVRTYEATVLGPAAANAVDLARDVLRPIAEVMRSSICRMTLAAVGLSCPECRASESKCRQRLEKVAPNTTTKRFVRPGDVDGRDRQQMTPEVRGRPSLRQPASRTLVLSDSQQTIKPGAPIIEAWPGRNRRRL